MANFLAQLSNRWAQVVWLTIVTIGNEGDLKKALELAESYNHGFRDLEAHLPYLRNMAGSSNPVISRGCILMLAIWQSPSSTPTHEARANQEVFFEVAESTEDEESQLLASFGLIKTGHAMRNVASSEEECGKFQELTTWAHYFGPNNCWPPLNP